MSYIKKKVTNNGNLPTLGGLTADTLVFINSSIALRELFEGKENTTASFEGFAYYGKPNPAAKGRWLDEQETKSFYSSFNGVADATLTRFAAFTLENGNVIVTLPVAEYSENEIVSISAKKGKPYPDKDGNQVDSFVPVITKESVPENADADKE